MRLHANALSGNSAKVRFLLARLGLACEMVEVDIFRGESRTPAFLAMNVAGQTPVLELEDGTAIAESNAILCHLAEGTPLFPAEPVARAETLRWMFFEQNQVMPTIAWARFIRRFLPEDHPMRARLGWLDEGARSALGVLERHLAGRPRVVGETLTIADIALHGYGHLAPEAGIDLGDFPEVARWLGALRAEPGHVAVTAASESASA